MVIQVHLDNMTAVAYINYLEGTNLCSLAVRVWDWSLQRHLFLVESHIPGVNISRADLLSRSVVDRHNWQLNPKVFRNIDSLWAHCWWASLPPESLDRKVLQLEARSSTGIGRCFQSGLDQLYRLCQP